MTVQGNTLTRKKQLVIANFIVAATTHFEADPS